MSFFDDIYNRAQEEYEDYSQALEFARVAAIGQRDTLVTGTAMRAQEAQASVTGALDSARSSLSSLTSAPRGVMDQIRSVFDGASRVVKYALIAGAILLVLFLVYIVTMAIGSFYLVNKTIDTVGTGVGLGLGRAIAGG